MREIGEATPPPLEKMFLMVLREFFTILISLDLWYLGY